jgi:phosphonoacetaldehyde hydrolase
MNTFQHSPYSGPLKAVIFDWAGTTVDYGCFGPVRAFREVFRTRFIEPTVEEVRQHMGLDKLEHLKLMSVMPRIRNLWLAIYGEEPGETAIAEMLQHFEAIRVRSLREHSSLVPGLLDVVAYLRGMGLRIGSTTGYNSVVASLMRDEAARLGYWPDCVVCASDVPAGRPHPWMCFRNAMELGVYPMSAMVKVGDTIKDVHEGLNAGMWTVAVTESGNEMGLTHADVLALSAPERARRLRAIEERMTAAGAHFVIEDIRGLLPVIDEINHRLASGIRPDERLPSPVAEPERPCDAHH